MPLNLCEYELPENKELIAHLGLYDRPATKRFAAIVRRLSKTHNKDHPRGRLLLEKLSDAELDDFNSRLRGALEDEARNGDRAPVAKLCLLVFDALDLLENLPGLVKGIRRSPETELKNFTTMLAVRVLKISAELGYPISRRVANNTLREARIPVFISPRASAGGQVRNELIAFYTTHPKLLEDEVRMFKNMIENHFTKKRYYSGDQNKTADVQTAFQAIFGRKVEAPENILTKNDRSTTDIAIKFLAFWHDHRSYGIGYKKHPTLFSPIESLKRLYRVRKRNQPPYFSGEGDPDNLGFCIWTILDLNVGSRGYYQKKSFNLSPP